MNKTLHLAAAALVVGALAVAPSVAHAGFLNIGIETWTQGDHWYVYQLGAAGKDVYLTNITCPVVSIARQPGAPISTNLREALISITSDNAILSPVDGKLLSGAVGSNYSVSNNYATLIMKQVDPVPVLQDPLVVNFPTAMKLPAGKLKILVVSQTWGPGGQVMDEVEAPDLEMQCDLFWKLAP